MSDEERRAAFARLLRWYPASWRSAHAEVVLGTMLDVAEAEGRATPTPTERRAAVVDGLGHRLDRRFAIAAAIAATAFGVGSLISISAPGYGAIPLAAPLLLTMQVLAFTNYGAALFFSTVSLLATARTHGLASPLALAAAALSVPASAAVPCLLLAWSIGMDEADAGRPASPLVSALPAIAVLAWVFGTILLTVVLSAPLRRLGAAAIPVAVMAGAAGWPLLTYASVNPATTALLGVASLAIALLFAGRTAKRREAPASLSSPATTRSAASRTTVRLLATVSAATGSLAVVFCLTGAHWSMLDATEAMRAGIAAGMVAAIPLTVAFGVARASTTPLHRWGPPCCLAAALAIAAAGNLPSGDRGNTTLVALFVAAIPLAAGIAWYVATLRVDDPRSMRVALGIVTGLPALILAPMLQAAPFVLPLVAIAVALMPARRASSTAAVAAS